jgi:uncharacterized protein YndB with AHSA1/START domain
MMRRLALAVLLATSLSPAQAAVVTRDADGFVSTSSALVPKPPAAVWAALVQWDKWWSPAHSYSGKATNFTLVPRASGSLLESWDGQSVQHAAVLTVMPGKLLRLQGGFGPLQSQPVNAVLDFTLTGEGDSTRLTLTYRVGGPAYARLPDLAAPVDAVMTEALSRLARFAATGQP